MAVTREDRVEMETLVSNIPFGVENTVRNEVHFRDLMAQLGGASGVAMTIRGDFTRANADSLKALAVRLNEGVRSSEHPSNYSKSEYLAELFADCNIQFEDHTVAVDKIFASAEQRVSEQFKNVGGFSLQNTQEERDLRGRTAKMLSRSEHEEAEQFVVATLSAIADRDLSETRITVAQSMEVRESALPVEREVLTQDVARESLRESGGRGGR